MRLGTLFFGAALACFLLLGITDAASDGATPMGQVKKMLAALKTRVQDEGTTESANYQKFTRWCDLEAQQCKSDIKAAEGKAEEAQADLNEAVALQSKQEFQIEKLAMVISHKESDLQGAVDRRKVDHSEFLEVHAKLQESIDTFERALQILNEKATPEALTQVTQSISAVLRRSAVVPGAPMDRMQAFFQQVSDTGALNSGVSKGIFLQQPSAPVYVSRKNQVLQIVAEMRDEVKTSQKKVEDEETEEAHTFALLEQSMQAEIASVNKEMTNAKQALNALKERQAELEQELTDANNMKEERETYMTDIGTQCDEKSREFTERNKARLDEVNAINEAIKILSTDRANEVQKREPGHNQAADFFAQLAPTDQGDISPNAPGSLQVGQSNFVGGFLQVNQLTNRVVAMLRADPFGKVKKMIEGMVEKLLQEQAESQEHKQWCDEETGKTKKSLSTHTRNKDKFQSRIDEMTARSSMLKQQVSDTSTGIANLKEAFAQAQSVRKLEHDTAVAALKDYKDAQMMIQKALQVLSDFYRKQRASSAALLQQSQSDLGSSSASPPATFGAGNVGDNRKDAAEGVLSILEIALSDFARLESETTTEEDTAQKAFETFSFENKQAIALAETDVTHFTEEISRLERDLQAANKDLSETTSELSATEEYMADLTKNCDWSGPSYEEQQKRRKAELESLQNALLIISGEAIA